jgi:YidC/Oxa1 family membrane protein insertase
MDKRTILAVVLSLAVLFLYQTFFVKPPVREQTGTTAQQTDPKAVEVTAPVASGHTPDQGKTPIRRAALKPEAPPKDVVVETPQYIAVFSTRGAALKSIQLKDYYQDCYDCVDDIFPRVKSFFTGSVYQPVVKTKDFIQLVDVHEGMPYPLSVTFPGSSADVAPDAIFETGAGKLTLSAGGEKQTLTFSRSYDDIKIEKIYSFSPDGYTMELEVRVHNLMGMPITQTPRIHWYQYVDPLKEDDTFGHEGPVTSVAGSIDRQSVKKLNSETTQGPNVLWGAFESKYFIASFIPENPSLTNISLTRDPDNMVTVGMTGRKELIPAGQLSAFTYTLYMGPKQYNLLTELGVGLENAIDYGWFKWLAIPFLYILNFLTGFVHNYGVAIILLTLMVKIIFWPLQNISYKSMKKMQEIQPKVTALKEKFKNDQSKIGQETMALYRENKVNPFSGCLPIVVQIPVFFGLYKALMYSIELRHSPFFFWIQDMSVRDPYYITPVIMGLTQFITQKMTPSMGDPMQQKIMLMMPVIFTFFFLSFPSGLVIYWLFSNIFGIAQQYYVNKKLST